MFRLPMLFWLSMVLSGSAVAEPVNDLYNAQAIVTGTVEPERTRGFRLGLTDVIVKLTGDIRLAESGKLAPLLEKPHPLVEHFEYEDRMKNLPVRDEQGTRERPHYLRMRFNAAEMDKALARLGLAKWGEDRPLLAMWVGVKTAVGSYVVTKTGEETYGQRAVIAEVAQRRGIPVRLPDAGTPVTFADIASGDSGKIDTASAGTDASLTGVLSITDAGYWDIAWQLRWKGQMRAWTVKGVSFDAAFKDGLQTAALVLSGNMAM